MGTTRVCSRKWEIGSRRTKPLRVSATVVASLISDFILKFDTMASQVIQLNGAVEVVVVARDMAG